MNKRKPDTRKGVRFILFSLVTALKNPRLSRGFFSGDFS